MKFYIERAMALSIKDEATDRLVRRYAALRKTSYTKAINIAVGDALRREEGAPNEDDEHERRARNFVKLAREIGEKVRSVPELDARPWREILYDEDGLPH